MHLASDIFHGRKTHFGIVCLLLLSACTSSHCPTGDCTSTSDSERVQVTEQTSAPVTDAVNGTRADVAMVSRKPETNLADEPARQAQMGDRPVKKATNAADVQGEKVAQISYDDAVIKASVVSTGCTLAEDFQVEHEIRDSSCLVTLVRTKPDYCRRAPFMVEITIDWVRPAECESLSLKFTNPIGDLEKATSKSSTARELPKE